jgi:hypothetical protein
MRAKEERRHRVERIFGVVLLSDDLPPLLATQSTHSLSQIPHGRLFLFGHLAHPGYYWVLAHI